MISNYLNHCSRELERRMEQRRLERSPGAPYPLPGEFYALLHNKFW